MQVVISMGIFYLDKQNKKQIDKNE